MKKVWLAVVAMMLVLGITMVAVPQGVNAEVTLINVSGDCEGAIVTARFSGAEQDEYQESYFSAWLTVPPDAYAATFEGFLWSEENQDLFLDGYGFPRVKTYNGEDIVKDISLSWPQVPRGTTITIYVDHYIESEGFSGITSLTFSYNCGPGIYPPETDQAVLITVESPVYSAPQFGAPIAGEAVLVDQEFLLIESTTTEGVEWHQVFIGGSTPWIPSTVATVIPR